MSIKTLLLPLILLSGLCFNLHASQNLLIKQAWIPEAPPSARVMAGFMDIHNSGNQDIDIISVSSAQFDSVEMHLSIEENGTAKMLPQKQLTIPAQGKLVLTSGSYHLMLIKPLKRLLEGDKAALRFSLSNGETINLNVTVKKNSAANTSTMKCGEGKCGGGKCGSGK